MLYLANPCSSPAVLTAMTDGLIGLIDSPLQAGRAAITRCHAAGVTWAADNGAFSDSWDPEKWWAWLTAEQQLAHRHTCLFATAPDIVADAWASHLRAAPWLPRIRDLGYPVAYVAQDGLQNLPVPWSDLDVLFLGGSTEWKLGAAARDLTRQALDRGKRVHMGRVNSERRYEYARAIGCHTVDGTYLTFGPDLLLPNLLAWGRNTGQPTLF